VVSIRACLFLLLFQQGLKALQVGDLRFDADKVVLSHVAHFAAGLDRRLA